MTEALPQLIMEHHHLDDLPEIALPDGYQLRTFQPGDETGLATLFTEGGLGENSLEWLQKEFLSHPLFAPERVYLITHQNALVATATAWLNDPPEMARLHMVAASPAHRGKKLGAIVTLATLQHAHHEGFKAQQLSTDDTREAAIRLYLKLGYQPVFSHSSHPERWKILAEKLHHPNLLKWSSDHKQ